MLFNSIFLIIGTKFRTFLTHTHTHMCTCTCTYKGMNLAKVYQLITVTAAFKFDAKLYKLITKSICNQAKKNNVLYTFAGRILIEKAHGSGVNR